MPNDFKRCANKECLVHYYDIQIVSNGTEVEYSIINKCNISNDSCNIRAILDFAYKVHLRSLCLPYSNNILFLRNNRSIVVTRSDIASGSTILSIQFPLKPLIQYPNGCLISNLRLNWGGDPVNWGTSELTWS